MAAAPQRQRTAGGVHWMDAEMDLEEATLMIQSKSPGERANAFGGY